MTEGSPSLDTSTGTDFLEAAPEPPLLEEDLVEEEDPGITLAPNKML
jgi:hypothetical protein